MHPLPAIARVVALFALAASWGHVTLLQPGPGEVLVSGVVVGPGGKPAPGVDVTMLAYDGEEKGHANDTSVAETGVFHMVSTDISASKDKVELVPTDSHYAALRCVVTIVDQPPTRRGKARLVLLDDPAAMSIPLDANGAAERTAHFRRIEYLRVKAGLKSAPDARADLEQAIRSTLLRLPHLERRIKIDSVMQQSDEIIRELSVPVLPIEAADLERIRDREMSAYLEDPVRHWADRIQRDLNAGSPLADWMIDFDLQNSGGSLTKAYFEKHRDAVLDAVRKSVVGLSPDDRVFDAELLHQLGRDPRATHWMAERLTGKGEDALVLPLPARDR